METINIAIASVINSSVFLGVFFYLLKRNDKRHEDHDKKIQKIEYDNAKTIKDLKDETFDKFERLIDRLQATEKEKEKNINERYEKMSNKIGEVIVNQKLLTQVVDSLEKLAEKYEGKFDETDTEIQKLKLSTAFKKAK